MRIEKFEDIEAWQLARELTRKVYDLTKKPEFARDFGLKGQIQDAAGSSMHNIAEGFDSESNPFRCGRMNASQPGGRLPSSRRRASRVHYPLQIRQSRQCHYRSSNPLGAAERWRGVAGRT